MEKWHSLTVREIEEKLNTDVRLGLSEEEASKRLLLYGPNQVIVKKRPMYVLFLNQFMNFLIAILLVATAISLFLGEKIEAIAIFAVVLIMGVMGFVQEYRTEKTLEALKKLITPMSRVVRGGEEKTIPSTLLVPGDLVILRAGDIVPADLRLIETIDLELDESSFTGESTPVEKNAEIVLEREVQVSDRINMAFMGTSVLNGQGKGIVVATGNQTELGRIAKIMAEAKEEKTPLEKELDYFAKRVGIIIIGISIVVFALSVYEGAQSPIDSFMTAIALAVAAVPEGLPAIATGVLAIGAYRMAKRNALVRKLSSVETLGSVNVVCSDKTGTITKGEMSLKLISFFNAVYDVQEGSIRRLRGGPGEHSVDRDLEFLIDIIPAHVGKDAEIVEGTTGPVVRGSPTEGAVLYAIYKIRGNDGVSLSRERYPPVNVYPFDRFRKMKSTVHRYDNRYLVVVSGAPDIIMAKSANILVNGVAVTIDENIRERLRADLESLGSQGYRTLGFAIRWLENYDQGWTYEMVESDLTYVATLGIVDPPREGVADAIKLANRAGVKVVMVTGDHSSTARAIARMIGLSVTDDSVLEGKDLERMTDDELLKVIDKITVFARVTPDHKVRIVKAFKRRGYRVAMTGDGVNDAPALKIADIGIAMGIKGTEVAREAAQIVLLDDNFSTIIEAIKQGRVIFDNLKKPINFLLSCNLGEIATIFGAELLRMPIPLKPLQILWINVVTDVAPAMALGVESPEPDIMYRPPRSSGDRLITARKMAYYIAMGAVIGASVLMLFKYMLHEGILMARTMAFTSLVMAEIGLVLAMRSEVKHFWQLPYNKWILPSIAVAIALQWMAIYTPLSGVFNTMPLDLKHWMIALTVPLFVIAFDGFRKAIKIRL